MSAAQTGTGNLEDIQKIIEACHYWRTRIQYPAVSRSPQETITILISDFIGYSFASEMAGFKKALVRHIAGCMLNETDIGFNDIETVFDLLLDIQDYQIAENLVTQHINRHPMNKISLYLQAQVLWLIGNYSEANIAYARALLCCPGRLPEKRIVNNKLNDLIRSCGPAMAPAFGWVRGVLPFVPQTDEIKACDEEHLRALESYRLLQKAYHALNNEDLKSCVNYRKQLKTHSPVLYDEYFNLLKQRT